MPVCRVCHACQARLSQGRRFIGSLSRSAIPIYTRGFNDLVIRPFRPLIQTKPHAAFSRSHAVPHVARKFVEMLRAPTNELIKLSGGMLKPPGSG